MAAVTGTVADVFGFTTPAGAKNDSSGNQALGCFISVTYTGTYATADDASCANVHTAIATARRDGKTVTLLDAAFAAPGDEAGTRVGANTTAVSGTTITSQLTGADLTTEHTAATLGTFTEGIKYWVAFTLS